jgi:pimeloyl-ACP methyl ester carboxylesterase
LHGGPGLPYGYLSDLIEELRASYEVAIYQQRGLAPSVLTGPFTVEQEVLDVRSVLDALEWDRAWIVGHSWGGHLLLHVAVAHPERLHGGLAVDTLGAVGDGGAQGMEAALEARIKGLEAAGQLRDPDATGLRRVWPGYFAEPHRAPEMPEIETSRESMEGIFATVVSSMPTLAARLGDCKVPMAFLAGEASPLPPDEASGATAALMPDASLEIVPGAGHFPWVERPGCVRSALDQLVARVPGGI